jgi:hypothetical protein
MTDNKKLRHFYKFKKNSQDRNFWVEKEDMSGEKSIW